MIKKLLLYIDTSVLNYVFADNVPGDREVTRELFKEIKEERYGAFISDVVIAEVSRAPEQRIKEILGWIEQYNLEVLEVDEEARSLAARYIEAGLIPTKYLDDALHIAVATVNNLDVIVSWNFEHIVKLKTKLGVNGTNMMLGYRTIEIYSPREVVES